MVGHTGRLNQHTAGTVKVVFPGIAASPVRHHAVLVLILVDSNKRVRIRRTLGPDQRQLAHLVQSADVSKKLRVPGPAGRGNEVGARPLQLKKARLDEGSSLENVQVRGAVEVRIPRHEPGTLGPEASSGQSWRRGNRGSQRGMLNLAPVSQEGA